eukprot:259983-Pelagomonas_calceolata.AAC.5
MTLAPITGLAGSSGTFSLMVRGLNCDENEVKVCTVHSLITHLVKKGEARKVGQQAPRPPLQPSPDQPSSSMSKRQ